MNSLCSEKVRNWARRILQDAQQGLFFQEDGLPFVHEHFYLLFLQNGLLVKIPEPTIHILLIQKQDGHRPFQKKKRLCFGRYLLVNARTLVKDRKEQTVKLKITTYMQISCTILLPQYFWP